MEESFKKIDEKVRWPQEATKNTIAVREIVRDWKPWSWKYKWDDKIAVKKKLTEKQKAFVDEYLQSHNATAAYRAAKGTLANREEWLASDRGNGRAMKNLDKVRDYLMEKIATDAELCLDYQMEMIQNEDVPAAVRHDAIKDRLNRLWVGRQKEEDSNEYSRIWKITITVVDSKPKDEGNIIEWEVLDKDNNNG